MYCIALSVYSKRQLVLATSGASSVKENIVSVFGQKQVLSMLLLALFSVWELWGCGGFRLGGGVL